MLGHTVDYFYLMNSGCLNHFTINLSKFDFSNGFIPKEKMPEIIGNPLFSYIDNLNDFNIYIYSRQRRYFYLDCYISMLKLSKVINKNTYDVLHIVGQNREFVFLHRLISLPTVFTFHEIADKTVPGHTGKNALIKFISRKRNNIIFHSENLKNKYFDSFKTKNTGIYVIKFGLFETYRLYETQIPEEPNTILFYGIINPYKGLEYLVDAFKLIKKEIPDIKLIIAGRGNIYFDKKDLEDSQIELINRSISEEELVILNKRAAVVVCPYTSASQSGIPVTSFIFCKPIIATNIMGLSEYIIDGYNGFLVPPKDSVSLAKKIIVLLRDKLLFNKTKNNIVKMNAEGSDVWLEIAKQTEKIYKNEINAGYRKV
ncbi:MAG: glycosyltransferase family 4 protein [Fibrobacter sp.]|nr:glycosyltransferase family 4 protein [Fibrobacter sp.]